MRRVNWWLLHPEQKGNLLLLFFTLRPVWNIINYLAIALCRALGIPARYVSAYAWRLAPPDFHAAIEAYLQGPTGTGWYLFDPTRMSAPDGLVRIGAGRDAADVAFCSPYGEVGFEKPEVWISGGDMRAGASIQWMRPNPATRCARSGVSRHRWKS